MMNVGEKRSSCVRSTLVGAAIGVAYGFLAAQKAMLTQNPSVREGLLPKMLSVGLIGGAVAGMLWPLLQRLRSRGTSGYYAGWVFALSVAGTIVMVPSAVTDHDWQDLLFGAFLGALAGFGMAAYSRYLRKTN